MISGYDNQKWKEDARALLSGGSAEVGNSGRGVNPPAAVPFPWKLHDMLDNSEKDGFSDVVSWQSGGKAFRVHQIDKFTERIMPSYFNQTKYKSFQRQLNLYGFQRISRGLEKGLIYHEFFVRNHRALCLRMNREKIKGQGTQRQMSIIAVPQIPVSIGSRNAPLSCSTKASSPNYSSLPGSSVVSRLNYQSAYQRSDSSEFSSLPLAHHSTEVGNTVFSVSFSSDEKSDEQPSVMGSLLENPCAAVEMERLLVASEDCSEDHELADGCPAFFEGHRFFIASDPCEDIVGSPSPGINTPSSEFELGNRMTSPLEGAASSPSQEVNELSQIDNFSSLSSVSLETENTTNAEFIQNALAPFFNGNTGSGSTALFHYGTMGGEGQNKKDVTTFRARYQGTAKRSSAGARAA